MSTSYGREGVCVVKGLRCARRHAAERAGCVRAAGAHQVRSDGVENLGLRAREAAGERSGQGFPLANLIREVGFL